MIFVEFKKFNTAHRVGVIASQVIQYEETIQTTATRAQIKCVKISMVDGRLVYVDEEMEDVAKAIDNARRLEQIEGALK